MKKWIVEEKNFHTGEEHVYEYDSQREANEAFDELKKDPNVVVTVQESKGKKLLKEVE